ncbi:MAG TPA: VOC family protein [Dehalococcoidia bacterium]|jgi:catechol 2,3-dioxygenase-like lactoylglutathione lyase family enzyme
MVTGFSHVYLPVPDVEAAVGFYTANLGFRLQRRWRTAEGADAAYLELGGVLLEVLPSTAGPQGERRFGLVVDNLDALLVELRARGVEIASEPFVPRSFWGRQTAIRDPFGYVVALREWQAPDGPRFSDWRPAASDTARSA